MDSITFSSLQTAALVILALAGSIATIGKAVETIKCWRKPQNDLRTELNACVKYLGADKARLDIHEEELIVLRDGLRVTCAGVQVLIEHELHNGNPSDMVQASKAINTWLLNK